jgi:hypothetical protein
MPLLRHHFEGSQATPKLLMGRFLPILLKKPAGPNCLTIDW